MKMGFWMWANTPKTVLTFLQHVLLIPQPLLVNNSEMFIVEVAMISTDNILTLQTKGLSKSVRLIIVSWAEPLYNT